MPVGGFSGRNLQGIVRVLQAFGNTGCYSYLLTELYDVDSIYGNFAIGANQNAVCVYDDMIVFVNNTLDNQNTFYGSPYVYGVNVGQTTPGNALLVNIGDTYNPPFNEPPIFNPISGAPIDYYSLAMGVVVDNNGFYVLSYQATSTNKYVQFSSFEYDWTPKANSGATTFDTSSGDAERLPQSISAYNGNLYTISSNGYLYVYDFENMATQDSWVVPDGATSDNHSISVWDDKIYVMQTDNTGGTKYCKVYVYELDGTFVEDFEILRHYSSGVTGKYIHASMIVDSGVIYSTGSNSQQQYTVDGTFICSSEISTSNNIAGLISWRYNGNIYLDNGKVITP